MLKQAPTLSFPRLKLFSSKPRENLAKKLSRLTLTLRYGMCNYSVRTAKILAGLQQWSMDVVYLDSKLVLPMLLDVVYFDQHLAP